MTDRQAYAASYRAAHKEALAAYNASYRVAHRETSKSRSAAYRAAHLDETSARNAAYRAARRAELKEYLAAYRAAHKEETAARNVAYRISHPPDPAYHAAYHAAHREDANVKRAAWAAAHPDRRRESNRGAKARRRGALVCAHESCLVIGPATLAWQTNPHRCYLCGTVVWEGVNLHMDHVIPVSRGGVHCAENLRPACATCNLRKRAKPVHEYLIAAVLP